MGPKYNLVHFQFLWWCLYIKSWSSYHVGTRCNSNPISTFPPCYPFQTPTELFHWDAQFAQSWKSDSDVAITRAALHKYGW